MSSERPPSGSEQPPERPSSSSGTPSPPGGQESSPPATPQTGPTPAPVLRPAEPAHSRTEAIGETVGRWARIVRFVLIVVLTFLVALFVLRNFDDANVDYVFGDVDIPLSVVILISVAIGMVLGPLLYWLLWSRHRPAQRRRR